MAKIITSIYDIYNKDIEAKYAELTGKSVGHLGQGADECMKYFCNLLETYIPEKYNANSRTTKGLLKSVAYPFCSAEIKADIDEASMKKKQNDKLIAEANQQLWADSASVLVTSGYNFEGYKIIKYSGYISGDDAINVERGYDSLFSTGTDVNNALMDSLTTIRSNSIKELKAAAYLLGCNAVIGVDFDYITLDPQTANSSGGTTYYPYIFCVTANGTAVKIEPIEE